jgi:hypothetical protein
MPTYSTPGVYVTESTLSSVVPVSVGGTAAVFYGTADRGPTEATLVTDWSTFKRLYGDLTDSHDLGYSVYHFFANGGRACHVVRVVGTYDTVGGTAGSVTPQDADTGATGIVYYPNGTGSASATLFDAVAVSTGTWGNNLSLSRLRLLAVLLLLLMRAVRSSPAFSRRPTVPTVRSLLSSS